MGRRKIEIKAIEDQNKRQVTFSKRRKGLFNKARQMCLLDETIKMGLVVFSPAGKPYSFANVPSVDTLIDCFVDGRSPDFSGTHRASKTEVLVDHTHKTGFWWEKVNVEEMQSLEELRGFQSELERLKETAMERLQSIQSQKIMRSEAPTCSSSFVAPNGGSGEALLNKSVPGFFEIDTPLECFDFDIPPPLSGISEDVSSAIDVPLGCLNFDMPPLSGDDDINALLLDLDMAVNLQSLF